MDTEPLEKQLHNWTRLMPLAMSSAVILLLASLDWLRWLVWFVLQIITVAVGCYLLWGKKWSGLPLSRERRNTIWGYFLAGWLLLLVPAILQWQLYGELVGPICYLGPIFLYSIFLLIIYWRNREKSSEAEEMFP